MTITELVASAHSQALKSGWWEDASALDAVHVYADVPLKEFEHARQIARRLVVMEKLALIGTEVAEAIEALRETGDPTKTWHRESDLKPEGLGVEVADIVIRCADLCGYLGIDLEAAIAEKMAFNATRSFKHGKHA